MLIHALIFAGAQGSCLNMRLQSQMFKHLPRHQASTNMCDCNSCIFYLILTKIKLKTQMKN